MEILKLRVLRGANYWSNYRKKLIVVKLNLHDYENLPTDLLDGFPNRLKELMPSLYQHRCSPGVEGGFFKRLEKGTWLGHVIEHVALELQWLAGMKCGYGRTRPTGEHGVYNIVFSYEIENAGVCAAKAAIKIVDTLAKQLPYPFLEDDLQELKQIYEHERLGPSTEAIIKEAEKRQIPCTRLDRHSLFMLGHGIHQKIICSTVSCQTSSIGLDIAGDKEITKQVLAASLIPIPQGLVIHSEKEINLAIKEVGFPLVVKPLSGNHGKGITTNITNKEKAVSAIKIVQKYSKDIIVEKFIQGSDYRLLIVNYKLVAAAQRIPAFIVGNGESTIQELIDEVNKNPYRGDGHQNFLTKIKIDKITNTILDEKGLSVESVLPKGQILYLKDAANISSGGTAVDVTDFVHPLNVILAERVARLVNLNICGIDVVTDDISKPLTAKNGAILEVNAGPGLRMHLSPTAGMKRNVAKPIVEMLFPQEAPCRIPVVAVTGTNGKTTLVRMIAYFAKRAGRSVGFACTDGIYIQHQQIHKGDCSGPVSASVVLRDPIVDFAVLECARGGILRSGLGFDHCSISIVTNVSEDHLGQDDIHTLEDMARVKSVVPRSTLESGHAILNADDDLVYAMKEDLTCNIALFSLNPANERMKQHCNSGGLVAYIEDDTIFVQRGNQKDKVADISDIPIAFSGFATGMVINLLPAVLAGVISNFPIADIRTWLTSFEPSVENTPGRMNLFTFENFKVLIDYAHNEDAFIKLGEFFKHIKCQKKVGIIAATGDRRPNDIRKIGYYAGEIFDEIIIRHDRDNRGRTPEELTQLLKEGIGQSKNHSKVTVIPNEFDAIQSAMENAEPDTFIMYFPDEILKAVNFVKQAEERYKVSSLHNGRLAV